MNSIPLIKGNTPQEINTSIIALKKALSELEAQDRLLQGTDKDVQDKIKQINELIEGINTHLGTVDTHLTNIDGQITALQPVDTVTSGNMHSVTSNAVSNYLMSGSQGNPINDCNLATRNGIWYFANAQNCPPTSIGFNAPDNSGSLYVQAYSDIWIDQICQDFYSDGTIFIRSKKAGTWTPWKRVSVNSDFGQWETVANLGNNGTSFIKGLSTPNGKYLYIRLNGLSGGTYNNGDILFTVPEGWRPSLDPTRCIVAIDTTTDRITAGLDINSNGSASVYFHGHTPLYGQSVVVSGFYSDILLFIG
ncbi:MAG: hypothetical protein IIW54_02780 [Lachnospiraceae bacterium]|nr:hypothetical protein [Lachnospiraceae bacterium]